MFLAQDACGLAPAFAMTASRGQWSPDGDQFKGYGLGMGEKFSIKRNRKGLTRTKREKNGILNTPEVPGGGEREKRS